MRWEGQGGEVSRARPPGDCGGCEEKVQPGRTGTVEPSPSSR